MDIEIYGELLLLLVDQIVVVKITVRYEDSYLVATGGTNPRSNTQTEPETSSWE